MRLNVNNIGRVGNASIELNGITVLAGENGSGKSTVSKSLLSIQEIFYDLFQRAKIQRRRSELAHIRNWLRKSAITLYRIQPREIQESYFESNGDSEMFVKRIQALINNSVPDVRIPFENKDRILLSEEDIKAFYAEYKKIIETPMEYYANFAAQLVVDDIFKKQVNCLKEGRLGKISYGEKSNCNEIDLFENKIQNISTCSFEEKRKPIYITTSDLMSIVGNYRNLYSAEKYGTISYANSKLTQLLMEEISAKELTAEEYQKLEEQKNTFDKIFQQVLSGEIGMEEQQLTYHDDWCNANIELQNIASGMKIFLILKRLISNGVFLKPICLIIDEPETNLHPEWQLILAHLLVLLKAKMDVTVYLNSHSPYFVRAVEYYANEYQMLDKCKFYVMKEQDEFGLYCSEDVSQKLGVVYDKLAEPFNKIM